MRANIEAYRAYRLKGLRHAWSYSDMTRVVHVLSRWMIYAVVLFGTLYLISDKANAVNEAADNRVASKLSRQAAYIKELEAVLNKCLVPGEHPIRIGNEIHFCGTVATGIIRE